jgi:coenzyme F420-reducing hydrogenase alpha subunit
MGYMIEISEEKREKLSEHMEKILKHAGKAMQCIEELEEEMGHRGGGAMGRRYGDMGERDNNRGGYRNRGGYGERDDEDWVDDEPMGERRRRSRSTGRYM